ncbi:MAG: FkbM family methyltransferase [Gammaproteobacteria bacterium]
MAAHLDTIRKLVDIARLPGGLSAFARMRVRTASSLIAVLRLRACGLSPRRILDIGANKGQFVASCRAVFPEAAVIALEPIPALAEQLAGIFRDDPLVTAVCAAVGSQRETRHFEINEYSPSSSFLPLNEAHRQSFPEASATRSEEMTILPLDELMAERDIAPCDLIKIDVQGFEMEVLKGAAAALDAAQHAVIECSLSPLYEGEATLPDICAFLRDRGFESVGAVHILSSPQTGLVLQIDLLFSRAGEVFSPAV